jgi:hypothetical protein
MHSNTDAYRHGDPHTSGCTVSDCHIDQYTYTDGDAHIHQDTHTLGDALSHHRP